MLGYPLFQNSTLKYGVSVIESNCFIYDQSGFMFRHCKRNILSYQIFYKAIDGDASHKNEDGFVERFWGQGFSSGWEGEGSCGFFPSLLLF